MRRLEMQPNPFSFSSPQVLNPFSQELLSPWVGSELGSLQVHFFQLAK